MANRHMAGINNDVEMETVEKKKPRNRGEDKGRTFQKQNKAKKSEETTRTLLQ